MDTVCIFNHKAGKSGQLQAERLPYLGSIDFSKCRCVCAVCEQPVRLFKIDGRWTCTHFCYRKTSLEDVFNVVVSFLKSTKLTFVNNACSVCRTPVRTSKIKRYYVRIGCIPTGFSLFYPFVKCRVDVTYRGDSKLKWPKLPYVPTLPGWKNVAMFTDEHKTVTTKTTYFKSVCSLHAQYPELPFQLTLNICPKCGLKLKVNITASTPVLQTNYGPVFIIRSAGHFILKKNAVLSMDQIRELETQFNIGPMRWWSRYNDDFVLERGLIGSEYCSRCCLMSYEQTFGPEDQLQDIAPLPEFSLFEDLDDVVICWSCLQATNDYEVTMLPRCRNLHHSNVGMQVPLCATCRRPCWQCGVNPTPVVCSTTCFDCGSLPSAVLSTDFSGPITCPDLHPAAKISLTGV